MGFTYLRIYKSKSERIQRDKINQEKKLKKGKDFKILGNYKIFWEIGDLNLVVNTVNM